MAVFQLFFQSGRAKDLSASLQERCQLLKLYNVGDRWMNDYGAPVECFWQGETEVLEENPVPAAHRCNLADIIVGAGVTNRPWALRTLI